MPECEPLQDACEIERERQFHAARMADEERRREEWEIDYALHGRDDYGFR